MPETRTVKITYEYDATSPLPCIARCNGVLGVGETFEEAKRDLLDALKRPVPVVPPPEEVEVECKS